MHTFFWVKMVRSVSYFSIRSLGLTFPLGLYEYCRPLDEFFSNYSFQIFPHIFQHPLTLISYIKLSRFHEIYNIICLSCLGPLISLMSLCVSIVFCQKFHKFTSYIKIANTLYIYMNSGLGSIFLHKIERKSLATNRDIFHVQDWKKSFLQVHVTASVGRKWYRISISLNIKEILIKREKQEVL